MQSTHNVVVAGKNPATPNFAPINGRFAPQQMIDRVRIPGIFVASQEVVELSHSANGPEYWDRRVLQTTGKSATSYLDGATLASCLYANESGAVQLLDYERKSALQVRYQMAGQFPEQE